MSKASNAVIEKLYAAGYTRMTQELDVSKFRIAHCVYVVLNDNDTALCFHSARAPMAALTKFQQFMKGGKSTYLPIPIQNYINWSLTSKPDSMVGMWFKTGKFINHALEANLMAIPGVTVCTRKPRDTHSMKNIYKMSLYGVPGYMLVSSIDDVNKAGSAWLTRVSQTAMATHKASNLRFREWCVLNERYCKRTNLVVETLATQLVPGADKLFMSLYVQNPNNQYELCLNQRLISNA